MRAPVRLDIALLFAFNPGLVEAASQRRRDGKGRFLKRLPAKAALLCRNIKTKKFARCGLPDTEPVS